MKKILFFGLFVVFSIGAWAQELSGSGEGADELLKNEKQMESIKTDAKPAQDKIQLKSPVAKSKNPVFEQKVEKEVNTDLDLFKSIDYPELQVVPRASERLLLEASEEKDSWVSPLWTIQVSALATLIAAVGSSGEYNTNKDGQTTDVMKEEHDMAISTAYIVGGGWLLGSWYFNREFSYQDATKRLKKITGKDKKSELMRERMAEEALEAPANLVRTLNRLSVISNFLAASYVAAQTSQTQPSYAGFAVGLSILPWIFENRYVSVWEKHQEYKRKIYAPLVWTDLKYQGRKEWVPYYGISFYF